MEEDIKQNVYCDAAAILEVGISIELGVKSLQQDYMLSDEQTAQIQNALKNWTYEADPEFAEFEQQVKQALN